jgi:hypothetical protein
MGYLVSNDIFFATNFVVFYEKKIGDFFYKKISVNFTNFAKNLY